MKILTTFFFIFIFSSVLQSQDFGKWTLSDDKNGIKRFNSVVDFQCIDTLNCMQLYQNGNITYGYLVKRTTDGGETWKNVYIDTVIKTRPRIFSFSYPNKKLFIAVGDSGIVIRSTDNGETWESFRIDTSVTFGTVIMYDEKDGFIFGGKPLPESAKDYKLWKTRDGGKTWFETPILDLPLNINNFQMVNRDLIMANVTYLDSKGNYKYNIMKIYNDWTSWYTVPHPGGYYRHFLNENIGWTSGNRRTKDSAGIDTPFQLIHHTTDGGKTWTKQRDTNYLNYYLGPVQFYDKNFGFCGSIENLMLMTFDGGKHWLHTEFLDKPMSPLHIRIIRVPGPNIAFAVSGGYNWVYKWTRPTTSAAEQSQSPELRITPNPAGDYIDIAVAGNRTLKNAVKVYNVLGVCMVTHPLTPSKGGQTGLFIVFTFVFFYIDTPNVRKVTEKSKKNSVAVY